MNVVLDEDALAELLESVAWYEDREEGLGQRFLEDVNASLRALPAARLKPLKSSWVRNAAFVDVRGPWPFRLIVFERSDTRTVVAVAHNRRRADYWADRLKR